LRRDDSSSLENCVFCRIIAGELSASIVYEDAYTVAFMDQRQPNPGHVLVVPRRHIEMIYDLDDNTAARLSQTVVKISRSVHSALNPLGLNIWQSNGQDAGQEVPHVHFHIFPRHKDDGCFRIYPHRPPTPPLSELDAIADRIRQAIDFSHVMEG